MLYLHKIVCFSVVTWFLLLVFTCPAVAGEIEELKAQNRLLMDRVEALMGRVEALEQTTKVGGRAEQITKKTEKPKQTVSSGNDKVRLEISGYLNRGVFISDDGSQTDVHHVDGPGPSRFRIKGKVKAGQDLTIGSILEVDFRSNSIGDVSQLSLSKDASNARFNQRHMDIYFASETWGKLSLGQGDTASNKTSEVDLSGTKMVARSNVGRAAGSLIFRQSNGLLNADNPTIDDVFSNMDGLSRKDRIRYDSPKLSGLRLSVGATFDDVYDGAIRYGVDLGPTKIAVALGAASSVSKNTFAQYSGSGSALWDNGFSVSLAGGIRDAKIKNREDPVFYYAKLGKNQKMFDLGKTGFSVDYQQSRDVGQDGDIAHAAGLQIVQKLSDWATELYFDLRRAELDRPGVEYHDLSSGLLGARVKF